MNARAQVALRGNGTFTRRQFIELTTVLVLGARTGRALSVIDPVTRTSRVTPDFKAWGQTDLLVGDLYQRYASYGA